MSNNKIRQLRAKEFEDVSELKILNLNSNGIAYIDPGKNNFKYSLKIISLLLNTVSDINWVGGREGFKNLEVGANFTFCTFQFIE